MQRTRSSVPVWLAALAIASAATQLPRTARPAAAEDQVRATAQREPDPGEGDVIMHVLIGELLDSPVLTDARFAGMRRALAELVPNAPAMGVMPESRLRFARQKPGRPSVDFEATVAMGPLVYYGWVCCVASDEAPPRSVQLYHEALAVLGQDPDGPGRAVASAILVDRFLETNGKVDEDRRPRPELVRSCNSTTRQAGIDWRHRSSSTAPGNDSWATSCEPSTPTRRRAT